MQGREYVASRAGQKLFSRAALAVARSGRCAHFSRMPSPDQPPPPDAEALTRALELELIRQRAGWAKTRAQRGTWRALSILFLLLLGLAGLLAYFFLVPELRSRASGKTSAPVEADR